MACLVSDLGLLRGSASAPLVFPPCASFEKPYDLDIVRKIVEREGCIESLKQLLVSPKARLPTVSGMLAAPVVLQSIVDQLRSVSVQIVESIEEWYQQQPPKAQATTFRWRGVNYLLKMTADLDFLASARDVPLLESLQALRLTQNPFLAPMHLDHPTLRESDPAMALQLLGNWVGDVSMRRVFSASKVLLREQEAENRRRRLLAENIAATAENHDSKSIAAVMPLQVARQPQQKTQVCQLKPHSSQGQSGNRKSDILSAAAAAAKAREDAMREDIALSRELVTQVEHELGAVRDELAALQERLQDVILPEKRRRLQNRIGNLVNELKFRSGDLYQRQNELKRKEAIYRGAKDRRPSSSDKTRARSHDAKASSLNRDWHKAATYSPTFEAALEEDEQVRDAIVQRVNAALAQSRSDSKRRMGLPDSSRRIQKVSNHVLAESQDQQLRSERNDVKRWGVCEVQEFLDSLGLDNGTYGATLRSQGIDGVLLVQAGDQDLEELGVSIRLHRVRILDELKTRQGLRG